MSSNSKKCSSCGQEKSFAEFYPKRGSYESICKSCKALVRKNKEESKKSLNQKREHLETLPLSADVIIDTSVERPIPPLPIEQPNNTHIEPAKDLSFELWERKYGRELSSEEKAEIRYNLKKFVNQMRKGA